jgi:hypothetical protein
MKFLMRALLFVLAFCGDATQGATPPPESAAALAKTWQGKSVVLTARPMGLDSAQKHLGVVAASLTPLSVSATDVAAVAHAAQGAPLRES